MSDPSPLSVGLVPSADIAVPDHERVVAFYANALCTGDPPLWRGDLMNSRGEPIIGVGKRTEEHAALPLQWMPHIQVASVASSVERALGAGGTELMHGKDSVGHSQWAVLLDPSGAAFGLIPAGAASDAGPDPADDAAPDTGRIVRCEIVAPDPGRAAAFYRDMVGWEVSESREQEGPVFDCRAGASSGPIVARVRGPQGPWRALPGVWLLQLPVGDLRESVRRVGEAGGAVLLELPAANGLPASAVVRDPAGAAIALCDH